jgi:hypothetical protein
VLAAAGVAAGTGAAQLGLGYGLGVVVWPAAPTADDSVWLGSLGWATWIAASSTVLGAVIAARTGADRKAERPAGPFRFALAAAAAVGALLTVALVAVPAREAVRQDTFAPEAIAAGYAALGILVGLGIAYWAVVSGPAAANLIATACYLWGLAATAIVVEMISGRNSATYLTSWHFADPDGGARYGTIYWPSAVLTLLAALAVGAIAAWTVVRRGTFTVGAAASGAVGPLLVAVSFFVLAPQLTGALGQLESAYLIAPYAVLAGLAGSAAVVASGQRSADRSRALRHRPAPPTATGKASVPATTAPPAPTKASEAVQIAQEPEAQQATRQPANQQPADRQPADGPADVQPAKGPADRQPAKGQPADKQPAKRRPVIKRLAKKQPAKEPPEQVKAAKSTVSAPPQDPPVARINPPREPIDPS